MVYFKDLNDPKSVFSVDPGNMEASFGSRVSLQRITVETTNKRMPSS